MLDVRIVGMVLISIYFVSCFPLLQEHTTVCIPITITLRVILSDM